MDGLVGVAHGDVLADEGDAAGALRLRGLAHERVPDGVADGPDVEAELVQDLLVEPLLAQLARDGVDGLRHVLLLDDALASDVAEERELVEVLGRDRALGAADEDVGDDSDRAELSDGVLRGLGLELAGGLEVGHEREVDEAGVLGAGLEAELARGLEERQALDVARDAADLAQDDVRRGLVAVRLAGRADRGLDLVRDVRHDLDRPAEVAAGALAGEDGRVDAAGGEVACLRAGDAREALVVAEVEVRLRAVVRHEHLAVLVGRHRAGVDVEVGVELLHEDAVAAALQQQRERRARHPLAET